MEEIARHVHETLAGRGLRIDELQRFVRPLASGETLILAGSIAEGLANPDSDIDMILIGEEGTTGNLVAQESSFENVVRNEGGGRDFNVEVWPPVALDQAAMRMQRLAPLLEGSEPVPSDGTLRVDVIRGDELKLLHRIRTGVPLVHREVAEEWGQKLRLDLLSSHNVALGCAQHAFFREDCIAQAKAGYPRSALWMLRIALDELAGALLASVGETNPLSKWRVRLLERHRESIGRETVDDLLDLLDQRLDADAAPTLRRATAFADAVLGQIVKRTPGVLSLLSQLSERIESTMELDEA